MYALQTTSLGIRLSRCVCASGHILRDKGLTMCVFQATSLKIRLSRCVCALGHMLRDKGVRCTSNPACLVLAR